MYTTLLNTHAQKPNPLFLDNLAKVYKIRFEVFKNKNEDDIALMNFNQASTINIFADGKGCELLYYFDKQFGKLHSKFPKKFYELLNTSFVDTLTITAIEQARILIDEIKSMIKVFETKMEECPDKDKVGRNNGEYIDMPFKSMYKNWKAYLEPFLNYIETDITNLNEIPLGSKITSKNVELNDFFEANLPKEANVLERINKEFNLTLKPCSDRIVAMSQMEKYVKMSGTLNSLATVLMKLANDVRFLSSGPRSGFGEIAVPENEPGSSIMPGKVNPTQCESLSMVCTQVIGSHVSISLSNSVALFESNNFKPLIANNLIRSIKLLADGLRSFNKNCVIGIQVILTKKF